MSELARTSASSAQFPAVIDHDERTLRMPRQHPATPAVADRRRVVRRLAVLTVLALVLSAGSASAAPKGVVGIFGGATGTAGGQFNTPRGVAVYEATGDIYVVDGANHRIEQLSSSGAFIRAWGQDVIAAGKPNDVSTTAFEICDTTAVTPNVAADCKTGISAATTANGGDMNAPQGIAIDQSDGSVYVTDQGNRRLQKFDSTGHFQWAAGWDTIIDGAATGDPGNVVTFQTCTIAANCKTAAAAGAGAGRFGSAIGYPAVDPLSSNVYVADPANRRIQKFTAAGAFTSAFGWGVLDGTSALQTCTTNCLIGLSGSGSGQFASGAPTRVAVDSAGFIYATDTGNLRVQKFNPAGSSAAVFGATTLSAFGGLPPADIAVDPTTDHVFVVEPVDPSFERRIQELDFGGNLLDTHLVDSKITSVNGLAVKNSGSSMYVSSTTGGQRVFTLGTTTNPAATIAATTGVTATDATLNGAVNPTNGFQTGYHFEYSTNGVTWTKAPTADADAGTGNTDTPVAQAVTGLEPNTGYRARLVATRPFGGGSATSAETTFTTASAPPAVSSTGVDAITDVKAKLIGQVDPQSQSTAYRFEYSTDTSYGSQAPATSRGVGSGSSDVTVVEVVSGLHPNTTYHFRLVATNASGETDGPDRTFTTRSTAPRLPARAYEMVSPPDKNGSDVAYLPNSAQSSVSGDAVAFMSFGSFANAAGSPLNAWYLSSRRADGWKTLSIAPRSDPDNLGINATARYQGFSDDLSVGVFKSQLNTALVPGAAPAMNLYTRNNTDVLVHDTNSSPAYRLLSQGNSISQLPWFDDATPNFNHIVFQHPMGLTPDAPAFSSSNLYEYDSTAPSGSELRFVGILPDGTSAPSSTAGPLTGQDNLDTLHTISDDGSRILFTAPADGTGRLYMRVNGTSTVWISQSEATTPDPNPQPAVFRGASDDGSKVYFTSTEQLVDTDTNPTSDLYRYDVDKPAGHHLLLVSKDHEISDGDGADVDGVVAVNALGDHVYFVSTSQIVAGEPTAAARKLYVWNDDGTPGGSITYIGGVRYDDDFLWGDTSELYAGKHVRVTPDGRFLMFSALAQLTAYPTPNVPATYLYDASSHELSCVDCPDVGEIAGGAHGMSGGVWPLNHALRFLADDGRVFFQSKNALVPEDTNGKQDVYEYDRGDIRLISTGKSPNDTYLADASPSGNDVFFITREALVAQDQDVNLDLYDARVGGGFPAASTPPPACSGDDCQGQPNSPPSLSTAGSITFSGAGDLPGAARSSGASKVRVSKTKAITGSSGVLRIRVPATGQLTTSGAGLKATKRTVAKAGTVTVKLSLSARAKKALTKRGTLKTTMRVAFKPSGGEASTATISLTFKAPSTKKGH